MRVLTCVVLFVLSLLASAASAQPAAATAKTSAAAAPSAPGTPSTTLAPSASAPSVAGPVNPHGPNPHAGMNPHGQLTPDSSQAAPDLAPGTVEVAVVDADDRPISGIDVKLGILSQKISEGEQRSEKVAKTDASGRVRFSALGTTTDKSYTVIVRSGEAAYNSVPFQLRDNAGHRVLLHVYPVTSEMGRTVVFGAFVSVEPREDVFQCDVILHVFNVSRMGWVPRDFVIDLPEGFKAFSAGEPTSDIRFEELEGRGAVLRGTFPPGEERAQFRFQLPKPAESEVSFSIGLPDRVAQAQVVAAANPEMNIEVGGGFPRAESRRSQGGERVLTTMRTIKRGEPTIRTLSITLTGLRVPSMGRWVAVFIALGFAGVGVLAARGDLHIASAEKVQNDRVRARELILQELVAVERANAAGDLGPNAYDRARRALLDALARIGLPDEKKPTKKRRAVKA